MAERILDGIWNAERILHELLLFTDERGDIISLNLSDDSPYGIKVRRFVAVMKALGKEVNMFCDNEHLISITCSDEKMNELCQLLRQNLDDDYYIALVNPSVLKDIRERRALFETLLHYRKRLYKVEDIWSGVLECSHVAALGIKATDNIYKTHIKTASDVIDRMLVLLMGDDYDKSFTEAELLPYGYPDVTDRELEDMILDNW